MCGRPCPAQAERTINGKAINNWHLGIFPFIGQLCTWKILVDVYCKSSAFVLLSLIQKKKQHMFMAKHLNWTEGRKWKVSTLVSFISLKKRSAYTTTYEYPSSTCTHALYYAFSSVSWSLVGLHLNLLTWVHGAPAHWSLSVPGNTHALSDANSQSRIKAHHNQIS